MTHLLRRLTEQAMGIARPVRSSVRLPFADAPIRQAAAEDGGQPLAVTAPSTSPQDARQPTAAAPADAAADRAPAPLAEEAPTPPPVRVPDDLRSPPPADDSAPVEHATADPRGVAAPPSAPAADLPARAPGPRQPVDHGPPARLLASPARAADRGPSFAPAAPLLPFQPAAPTAAARLWAAQPAPSGASAGATDAPATEVHVSIGRIELTAVHESAAGKRAPARGPRPMTLEQYLARKRGGQP